MDYQEVVRQLIFSGSYAAERLFAFLGHPFLASAAIPADAVPTSAGIAYAAAVAAAFDVSCSRC
jgi:hypothetical protein